MRQHALTPLDIANKLHKEATQLIHQQQIIEILGQGAEVIFTGSYHLNLMAYPDIDIYLKVDEPQHLLAYMGQIAATYIQNKDCIRVKVEKQYHIENPYLPKGLFLSLKFPNTAWKLPWKFDIWVLEDDYLQTMCAKTKKMEHVLTPEIRELIVNLKQRWMNEKGKMAAMASHTIYEAIFSHQLTQESDIVAFVLQQGIQQSAENLQCSPLK